TKVSARRNRSSIDLRTVERHIRRVPELFVTKLYEADLGDQALLLALAHSIRRLSRHDQAGRRRSKDHRYARYPSSAPAHDEPRPGLLLMWESWLRHEVLGGPGRGERLSISFNFA